MRIREESIGHYLNLIEANQPFSFAGFSDAEWYCLLGLREGERTGFGQTISAAHGKRLLEVLRRRQDDPRFMVAVPRCIYGLPGFAEGQIDWFLGSHGIRIEAYERDTVTDDLAREAGLYPLVRCLEARNVCLIGNAALRPVLGYARLSNWRFVPVSSPNLHLEPGGIERAVARVMEDGVRGVYLVSAGVSAAVIIDQLHDRLAKSWFIDCGSMWDAFAGIGGQRAWRAELYADPARLAQWKDWNLEGKH